MQTDCRAVSYGFDWRAAKLTLDPLAGEEECLPPPVKPWCVSYGMTEVERKEKEITCKKIDK